ncbi:MAG: hypothetical protein KKH98_15865 [Spirochaetes bacterium]|nr:hypothetical protein [Spirochaetota bacterium]
MKRNKSFIIFLLGFVLSGCTIHSYNKGLTAEAEPIANREYEVIDTAEGSSSSFRLLWLFPVTTPADYNAAIRQAVNQEGGDNLIDVQYWYERQHWIIGTVDILYVKGKVIRYLE